MTRFEPLMPVGGYSMKEIGEYYGLHYSWISRIVGNKEQAKNSDP
jgi:hypothetical protein